MVMKMGPLVKVATPGATPITGHSPTLAYERCVELHVHLFRRKLIRWVCAPGALPVHPIHSRVSQCRASTLIGKDMQILQLIRARSLRLIRARSLRLIRTHSLWFIRARCLRFIKARCLRFIRARCLRLIRTRSLRFIRARSLRFIRARSLRFIRPRSLRLIRPRSLQFIRARPPWLIRIRSLRFIRARSLRLIKARSLRLRAHSLRITSFPTILESCIRRVLAQQGHHSTTAPSFLRAQINSRLRSHTGNRTVLYCHQAKVATTTPTRFTTAQAFIQMFCRVKVIFWLRTKPASVSL